MNRATKSMAVAACGTLIEYYDYATFSLFLPFLSPVFFPGHSGYAALSAGFYAILISSVTRPLGGLIFGIIGDYYGRRRALLISLYGIALATLAVGVVPGFDQIGYIAPLAIVLIRAFQMFCYGGEYSGAGIYVVELAKSNRVGFFGALLTAMALFGSVLAAIVGIILTTINKSSPNWRFAFILGGAVGLVAVFFRRQMSESLICKGQQKPISLLLIPIQYPWQFLVGVAIGGFITLPFTTITVFVNPILMMRGVLTNLQLMVIQFIISSFAVISLLIAGVAADKFSPYKVMLTALWCLLIIAYPFSLILNTANLWLIISGEIIVIIFNEILLGPSNAFFKQIFPPQVRYRGVAFSFCLGVSIIGGLTPVVENYFYSHGGAFKGVLLWITAVDFLTLGALLGVNRALKK